MNFRQLSVRQVDLPSTFVNVPCVREKFCQLSMRLGKPSANFCQPSVQPGDFLSTSVKFPCIHETFHQFL